MNCGEVLRVVRVSGATSTSGPGLSYLHDVRCSEVFHGFPRSLQARAGIDLSSRLRPLLFPRSLLSSRTTYRNIRHCVI